MPDGILRRLLEKPVVWTLHDSWLLSGRCAFSGQCEGYLRGCTNCPHPNYYPTCWVDKAHSMFHKRRSLPLDCCQLVVPSKSMCDRFSSAGFPSPTIIPNPISIPADPINPSELSKIQNQHGLASDRITLLFAAAHLESPAKGMDVLQQTLARLPHPEKYQLLVVGHYQRKPSFAVKTIYVGPVADRNTMATLYQLSHATLIPSLAETYGMTGPEALNCGSQVICNDLPVFRETMDHRAHFIAHNDPQTFAAAIEKICDKHSPSATTQKTAEPPPEHITEAYLALYRNAMASTPSG